MKMQNRCRCLIVWSSSLSGAFAAAGGIIFFRTQSWLFLLGGKATNLVGLALVQSEESANLKASSNRELHAGHTIKNPLGMQLAYIPLGKLVDWNMKT